MADDIVTRLREWAEFAERYVKGVDHMILTITDAADEIERLRADLYHLLYCPISECHLCAGIEAARRNDPTWLVADNAARTFSEYAAERDKELSTEGRKALEAFMDAHVLENTIFDASKDKEARRG